jgi:hypothetical protein
MTGTLTTIAETISQELSRAVEAAERAQNAGLDLAREKIAVAVNRRNAGLERASELEREAARLIAESLDVRENVEKTFATDMHEAMTAINVLKSEAVKPPARNGKRAAKELTDGRGLDS